MTYNVGDLVWITKPRIASDGVQVRNYGRLWRVCEVGVAGYHKDMLGALPFYLTEEDVRRLGCNLPYPWRYGEIEPFTGQTEEEQADDLQSR